MPIRHPVIITMLVGLFLCPVLLAQSKVSYQTDREISGLIGPVKSVMTKTSAVGPHERVEGSIEKVETESYDLKGHLTESRIRYRKVGGYIGQEGKVSYAYNEQGQRVSKMIFVGEGPLLSKILFAYDPNGNRTAEVLSRGDGSFASVTVSTYDTNNNPALIITYNWGPPPSISKIITAYDAQGHHVESSYENGVLEWKVVYSTDAAGHRLESFVYGSDGSLTKKLLNKYGPRGNPIESTSYRADGSIESKEMYTYEVDSVGNWIKKTTSKWVTKSGKSYFEPVDVTSRSVTYYR
jgi:hypothetical protein